MPRRSNGRPAVLIPWLTGEDKSTGFIYPHLSGYCYLAERYIPADKEYKRTLIKALVVVGKLNEVILPENKQGYDISICDKKDKPGLNAELFGIDEMASGEEDEVKYVFFSPEVASAKKCKITVTEKIGNIAAGEWADRRVIYNSAGESDEDEMSRRLMISEDFMEDDEYAVDDEGVKVRPGVDWVNVRIESVPKNCPFYIIPKRKYDAHEAVFKNISKCRRNLDDEMIDFLDNNFLCEKGHTNIEIPTEEKTCYVLIRHGRHASVLKMYQPNKTLPSTARIFFDFEKDRRP